VTTRTLWWRRRYSEVVVMPSSVSMGSVSMEGSWVRTGTDISISATPASGYHLARWGVFEANERTDQARSTSTDRVLSLHVDRPLSVVAGFLPDT
jgi:hypothetical protein